MERIVYEVAGSIAVVIPSGEIPLSEVIEKDVPDGALMLVIDSADLPKDRKFRNAWEFNAGKTAVTENLAKSRAIATEKIKDLGASEKTAKTAAIAAAKNTDELRAAIA